ncbi:tyrosine-type recombinase/integrase [Lonepinella sp. MS14436]|uniref:tyrosine-type recombinase/integrase n=1 Tax=Lonepinella sp. MS14436 TaxID=3003619 RepID=UPI0036DE9111
MAKIVKQLSTAQVNSAKPKDKIYYLSDGLGLRLAVKPNGSKTWLFNYTRPFVKKRTDKTIGTYPAISLANARAKAQSFREMLANNVDPHQQELEQLKLARLAISNTFKAVANEWLTYREKIGLERGDYSEKTKIDTIRRVNDAVNMIGDLPFRKLKLQHGLAVLEIHRTNGQYTEMRKRYFVLKNIAEYAERFGYWDKNEWRYLGEDLPSADKSSHHSAIHYKELPEFLLTLRKSNIHQSSLLAILWGLLNVTRASETVGIKFSDISENENLSNELVLTVKVNKGGKGEREHLIPLSRQAKTLLEYARKQARNDYLFPAVKRGAIKHLNAQTPNDVIKSMDNGKYKGVMTNHGFRTLFSSYCNDNRLELGLDSEIIEICLSHLNNDKVRNAYNRAEYLPYRLKTFQAWADYVELCAKGLFDEIKG